MLKKEDNFDNVEQHEQQKEVERHPSDHVPRPTSVTRKGAWIALAIVAFTLFMTIREINQTPANNPVTTIVFSDYLEPAKEINAQEFEKLYDEARRNKINFIINYSILQFRIQLLQKTINVLQNRFHH